MENMTNNNRRKFIKRTAFLTAGLVSAPLFDFAQTVPIQDTDNIYMIGPQEGYSP